MKKRSIIGVVIYLLVIAMAMYWLLGFFGFGDQGLTDAEVHKLFRDKQRLVEKNGLKMQRTIQRSRDIRTAYSGNATPVRYNIKSPAKTNRSRSSKFCLYCPQLRVFRLISGKFAVKRAA